MNMKTKKLEKTVAASLFLLVLVLFSFAERDSKKLDRLYKTAQLLRKTDQNPTVQLPPSPGKTTRN